MKATVTRIMLAGGVALILWACQPKTSQDDEFFPPESLIIANLQNTDISMEFVIVAIAADPARTHGSYGEWKVRAAVVRCFNGPFKPGQLFTYYWGFELGIKPPKPGSTHLASFKRNPQGEWTVPDNGYHFPFNKKLVKMFETAVRLQKVE